VIVVRLRTVSFQCISLSFHVNCVFSNEINSFKILKPSLYFGKSVMVKIT